MMKTKLIRNGEAMELRWTFPLVLMLRASIGAEGGDPHGQSHTFENDHELVVKDQLDFKVKSGDVFKQYH